MLGATGFGGTSAGAGIGYNAAQDPRYQIPSLLQNSQGILQKQLQQQSGEFESQQQAARLASQGQLQSEAEKAQAGLATQSQAGETERAKIAAGAAMAPTQLKRDIFGQMFPLINGAFGSLLGGGPGGAAGGALGGALSAGAGGYGGPGTAPNIQAGPVLNPQQIQQQVNTQNASTDASTASQQRANQQRIAGQGFSPNSPLLNAMNQGAAMGGQATKMGNETQTRLGAAQQNAQQMLAGQQAQQGQFAQQQQAALQAQQIQASQRNALLAAISNLG